ncbi:hypothetical protein K435DRAFT_419514 [Dendrothele bispora CBS 962.96]|uniref:Uncharacterized protein n=1 Tax=Dendrothele bispora (strain CBS 962.96) TaxID=1314807 RepID=A0A4S8L633_DENBC|nr:hypothetical protein K435DRAFT_419514 [Dendrothele bispora CBS 962.96]
MTSNVFSSQVARPAKRKEPPSDDDTVNTGCRTLPQAVEIQEKRGRYVFSNSSRRNLFGQHTREDDRGRAGPESHPTAEDRFQRDNMFYDTTLPDDSAYVISVRDVLFRVNRELVRSFSPKLTTDLDEKMAANTSHGKKNDDANPLVVDDSYPGEWQAMLWALSVDSSERMAHIETPYQLGRMMSLAIIANTYESVFEKDAMAAIYEACFPEHVDLQSPRPSSILNRCTSYDLRDLMILCKLCLRLDDSDFSEFSARNPLIPRSAPNKSKHQEAIAVNALDTSSSSSSSSSSKYPPFYENLLTMILRHWIAEMMPEARAWAIPPPPPPPLPKPQPQLSSSSSSNSHYPSSSQPVLPRASNVILPYTSIKDLQPPNILGTVNSIIIADELRLHELSGAAMYAYLRENEINYRLDAGSSSSKPVDTTTNGVGSGSGSGSHHPTPPESESDSDSAFFTNLILPSATTLSFDSALNTDDRSRLMKGYWSLVKVWEIVKREAGKLVPPEMKTTTTKHDGDEKRRTSFKAPSEHDEDEDDDDYDMDWESNIDDHNGEHDYDHDYDHDHDHEGRTATAAAPPPPQAASIPTGDEAGSVSGMIPGAFPSTATGSTKEPLAKEEGGYKFGTDTSWQFNFGVPRDVKMSDGGGGVDGVEVNGKVNGNGSGSGKDKGKGKEREKEKEKEREKTRSRNDKGKKKAAVELKEAQIASGGGGGASGKKRRPLKRYSAKILPRSSGHSSSSNPPPPPPPPPPSKSPATATSRSKRPHNPCISHQAQCIPIWERAFASYVSSKRMRAVPQGDVLDALALMVELLEKDGEERLVDMDEGCRWGAVERLRDVREQVWLGCLGGRGGEDGYFV